MSSYTLTRNRSISESIERLLNDQVQRENQASALYLSVASWCESQGFGGAAKFFYTHSHEEQEHMRRFMDYINTGGGQARILAVDKQPDNFQGLLEVIERALDHEIFISQAIIDLHLEATKEQDPTTAHFLNSFLEEQREEESLMRRALELAHQFQKSNIRDYLLDKALSSLHEKHEK